MPVEWSSEPCDPIKSWYFPTSCKSLIHDKCTNACLISVDMSFTDNCLFHFMPLFDLLGTIIIFYQIVSRILKFLRIYY